MDNATEKEEGREKVINILEKKIFFFSRGFGSLNRFFITLIFLLHQILIIKYEEKMYECKIGKFIVIHVLRFHSYL